MRKVNFSPYGTKSSDQKEIAAAMKSGDVWVEVIDPLSKWCGCIGKLDLTDYFENDHFHRTHRHRSSSAHNADFESLCDYYKKLPLWMDKKSIQVSVYQSNDVVVLLDYSGPAVYKYNKSPLPDIPTQTDILGTEILPGSFVAASGGTGMYLAKVESLYQERAGSNYTRIRARLKVIIDEHTKENDRRIASGKNPDPFLKLDTTIAIENIMVITPDIKQQAMIAKLSRP